MRRPLCLFCESVSLSGRETVLILNSAADPFVQELAAKATGSAEIIFAEDNLAAATAALQLFSPEQHTRFVPFHAYLQDQKEGTADIALLNLLYQPSNAWMYYALQVAAYALRPGGTLYVTGAKDRGIMSIGRRMQELFGNGETLVMSKGQRVIASRRPPGLALPKPEALPVFADSRLDEGTRLLLEAVPVRLQDRVLDLGCGAGFIGVHLARQASEGHVTMIDVSLAAVAAAQEAVVNSGLRNVTVLPGDGVQAVREQRFDLVVTNPPFHQGGIQTTTIAERFIRESAQVLQRNGRFYLVANRFLKYEPTMQSCYGKVVEVAGNTKYKVLCASSPLPGQK
ncbi:16S rRNA (guanine1207-N2)-methyltransferase [Thermosporothrix hazakensis]|uniref:16S rRNA (Guanine1207-N2)-methyltransferase n=1 Tax=Thermosporothrix hazakensis TaxID=644383 RepID=A0A326U2E7_THEHA|nr:methyltransferase [Thermosporothrix hazakensis]PZW24227.1 16S rRNA (guanine1207-N2)-methyltransferase [Thermosporothrix hazakensis]GCE47858.1 hypothetical protein KTH_27270 [Thermosporothrix hazakensis]